MELRGVVKRYAVGPERLTVLKGVDLQIHQGEYVSIVGPSGSGKSTMMHILGLLDTPTEGEYWFLDAPVHALSSQTLAHLRNRAIGFVFQNFFLLPRMSALQNVEMPLMYRGMRKRERREAAARCLESVGLGDRLDHWPNALSGGQRQRVAIARAMVNQPKVLLADEPTGALDSQTGRDIMSVFRQLNQGGTTIVIITHDAGVAEEANRVITVQDGAIHRDVHKQLGEMSESNGPQEEGRR